tara:strand:+ start:1933 stop:3015 length:1083 start_codon:yes stop_codon:yes gene_type:complete
MLINNKNYKTIWVNNSGKIKIIDQNLLPFKFKEVELKNLRDTIVAISTMQVRGAPLIGVTAAYGMHLAIKESPLKKNIIHAGKKLIASRPTAINLKWAVDKIINKVLKFPSDKRKSISLEVAKKLSEDDEVINEKIGKQGSKLILDIFKKKKKAVNILTHCNAGWLATVDWGTATSPIYKARDLDIPIHVWVDETRPRNQGSFLTSWELMQEKIDNTIITDNAGGYLMKQGLVDIVITGSDRTTFTGDVCNKIGTYLKALAAYENNVPFYVALPSSTIDWNNSSGDQILIEERNENEIHFIKGLNSKNKIESIRVTPSAAKAFNVAFDVTPRKYISGLITEYGIVKANKKEIMSIKKKIK